MGGHLKERGQGGSGGRKPARAADAVRWWRSLSASQVGPGRTAHACSRPCLFPSCSRTHSLSRAARSRGQSGSASELLLCPPPAAPGPVRGRPRG